MLENLLWVGATPTVRAGMYELSPVFTQNAVLKYFVVKR